MNASRSDGKITRRMGSVKTRVEGSAGDDKVGVSGAGRACCGVEAFFLRGIRRGRFFICSGLRVVGVFGDDGDSIAEGIVSGIFLDCSWVRLVMCNDVWPIASPA